MKKEARHLLQKGVNSLILSVEYFNRPWNQGRVEAVLIFLDHAFEMFLKAAIVHRGGKIRRPRENETIGFDACVRKAVSDGNIKFLSEEGALLLQTINGLRDAAQHYLLDISEQHLYIQAQAGLTLFKDLLKEVFNKNLYEELPERVLPLSTSPPIDFTALFDQEMKQIKQLLGPGKRRKLEATAKLRSLVVMENAIQGEKNQPSQPVLQRLAEAIKAGKAWDHLFPGVASLSLTTEGYGPSLDLRITKKEGVPVQLVPEGTPGAYIVGVKRVNELDFYSMNVTTIAKKLNLTVPKTVAVVHHLGIQDDPDCFKVIRIGSSKFKRYSHKALNKIQEALSELDLGKVWSEYQQSKRVTEKPRHDAFN